MVKFLIGIILSVAILFSPTAQAESFATVYELIYAIGVNAASNTQPQYFMTSSEAERDGLLASGWQLTGETFQNGGSTFVCRFYFRGAHYFTAIMPECDEMQQIAKTLPVTDYWQLEGVAFRSSLPQNPTWQGLGTCLGQAPVYHVYNPTTFNHRFVNLKTALDLADTQQWLWGSVAMCAPLSPTTQLMWNEPRENFLTKIEGCDHLIIDRNGYTPESDYNYRQNGPIDLYMQKCNVGNDKLDVKVWIAQVGIHDDIMYTYGAVPNTIEVYLLRGTH